MLRRRERSQKAMQKRYEREHQIPTEAQLSRKSTYPHTAALDVLLLNEASDGLLTLLTLLTLAALAKPALSS